MHLFCNVLKICLLVIKAFVKGKTQFWGKCINNATVLFPWGSIAWGIVNNTVAFMTDSSTPADMNIADDLVIQQNQRASCVSMEARKADLLYRDKNKK